MGESGHRWRLPNVEPPQVASSLLAEEQGESRWPPVLAVITAAGLYATLPGRFIAGSSGLITAARIIVPLLTLAMIAPLALTVPRQRLVQSQQRIINAIPRRTLAMALVALITLANGVAIVILVRLLVMGTHVVPRELLRAGIHLWCMNVLVFGLWFWLLDSGGPLVRLTAGRAAPDFLFPQDESPEFAPPGWRPKFIDYLYVSFTNATAFSPTDTMPLTQMAKMLMLVESAASILLLVMVAARAVNILH